MLSVYLSLIDSEQGRLTFEKIYNTYRKQMFMVAYSLLQNNADAEDVVHDVFLNIISKHLETIEKIKSDNDLRNYLLKATKNTALDTIKRKTRRDKIFDNSDLSDVKDISDDSFVEMVSTHLEYETIVNAIKCMDEKYREVLYYHFIQDMTVKEVSGILDRSISTVKMQIVRGKKILLSLVNAIGA